METQRQKFDRRLAALKNERSSFIAHWRDINEYLLPRRGRFLGAEVNKGDKRNAKIIDSEATQAIGILVSGMMSGITSPARRWFRLGIADKDMMEFGNVKQWLNECEDRLYKVFSQSNLYQMLPYVYEEMAVYGTAAMIQLPDFEELARFQVFTIGEYCIAQNERNEVNAVYREVAMTVEQIVREFGVKKGTKDINWNNISQSTKEAWDKGDYDNWVDTVHVIEPNDMRDYNSPLAKDKAFCHKVYEKATGGKPGDAHKWLLESGWDEFPVYCPRWHLQSPDVYGRSLGMDALGDVKQLQDQQKKKGQAIAKMVNPPMVGSSQLKNQRMSTLPGDITFVDATGNQSTGFAPAYQVQPKLGEFLMDMQDVRERIRRAFYADLFLMMAQSDRRQITAREIDERSSEKLLVLGPVMNRLNHMLLNPMIDTTLNRMAEVGFLPPPPEDLQGMGWDIEYISDMAAAQKAQGILGLQEAAGFVGNLATFNPDVIDKFDFDQSVDEYANMRGIPAGVVRSDDDVSEIRQAREQQQQQAAMQANMQSAAEGAKTLSDTDTAGENMLTDILSGGGLGTRP